MGNPFDGFDGCPARGKGAVNQHVCNDTGLVRRVQASFGLAIPVLVWGAVSQWVKPRSPMITLVLVWGAVSQGVKPRSPMIILILVCEAVSQGVKLRSIMIGGRQARGKTAVSYDYTGFCVQGGQSRDPTADSYYCAGFSIEAVSQGAKPRSRINTGSGGGVEWWCWRR